MSEETRKSTSLLNYVNRTVPVRFDSQKRQEIKHHSPHGSSPVRHVDWERSQSTIKNRPFSLMSLILPTPTPFRLSTFLWASFRDSWQCPQLSWEKQYRKTRSIISRCEQENRKWHYDSLLESRWFWKWISYWIQRIDPAPDFFGVGIELGQTPLAFLKKTVFFVTL